MKNTIAIFRCIILRTKQDLLYWIPFIALAVVTFSSCSSLLKVYAEEEPGANLSQYYSYKWQDNDQPSTGKPTPYPLSRHAQDKIRQATDAQMQRFGYQVCDVAPELLLHYHVIVENRVYFQPEWNCNDAEGIQRGYCHRVEPVYYREGTLIIDFVDARTNRQVWRGVAVGVVDKNYTAAQWDAEIENAVRLIFKRLPFKPMPADQAGTLSK